MILSLTSLVFQFFKGDINKMQKSITTMEEQIEKISSGREEVHLEDLMDLKDEIQQITANTQVQSSGSSNETSSQWQLLISLHLFSF